MTNLHFAGRGKAMKGFDYRTGTDIEQDTTVLRAELARVVREEGGSRRVENSETFVHGRDGKLLFEVYGYLPAPKAVA
jgi:hypothetical protein